MNRSTLEPVRSCSLLRGAFGGCSWVLMALVVGSLCCGALAQSGRGNAASSSQAGAAGSSRAGAGKNGAGAQSELAMRISAAAAARDSSDAVQASVANERLIGTALRELGSLRAIEGAYPQAIELYRSALAYDDVRATRVALAMAESQAGHYDEAIRMAEAMRFSAPHDLQADRILGSSLVQKGDYVRAIEPFQRIASAEPTVENEYALANCLLQTRTPENRARAVQVFGEMEKRAGDSGSLHVLFGRAYRDAEDMGAAVKEFERAIAIDARTPHAHYFLGLARLALNEWKPTPEAEGEIKKEVENFPDDYLANYMTGFLASGERRYEEAERYLSTAARIDPSAPEPPLYMGLDAYAQGDMKSAEVMLRRAVELTAGDEARSNFQIRRAYVDLGRILASSGRKEESEGFLTKARELQNKTMEQSQQSIATMAATAGAGSAAAVMPLSKQGEGRAVTGDAGAADVVLKLDAAAMAHSKLTEAERAEADAQEKLLRSTLGLAFNDLATSEAIRGQFADALAHYQQAERWDSSLGGLEKNLGQSAFRAGNYPEAIRGLSKALTAQPNSTGMRAMLGISYFNTDQYARAAETFAPLGEAGMADAEIGYAWAASLAHTGDMKRATEVLTVFSAQGRPNEVLLLIGQLWTAIGDYTRAVATFQQALQADPNLRQAHFQEGLADIHSEHWAEAAKEFQAELALSPGDADSEYHLGFVDMQQTKMDEAVAHFRHVVALHPGYPNAQYQLGKILLDRGEVQPAVGFLEAAARLSPQTDYIHYQLQAAYRKENRLEDADRELERYKQLKAKSRERAGEAAISAR